MTSFETPEWVRDAVFYQIFPDRFAYSQRVRKPSNLEPWDSPPTVYGFKGGDLLGVAERLDYLQDLGITAIYFNPVFQSAANHRYHTYDYYSVDPILGGNAALRTLLDEAHQRGIRVILDGVFNHASRGFFQFHHVVENGAASPYVDWFIIYRHPLVPYHAPRGQHGYEAWWNLPALPKLNVANPGVREFLWDVAGHWIEFGVDGWRLDVPAEIDDDDFWREFRCRVKGINSEAYIIGELWHEAHRWLQGDQFDAIMNYPFTRACLAFFVGDNLFASEAAKCGLGKIAPMDAQAFAAEMTRLLELYPRPAVEVQLNLLSSHDTPRFKTLARGDDSAYALATLFQMTYPGAPCIYYGDEIGMEGGQDPVCRGGFPWDSSCWEQSLRDYVKQCAALRHAHPALRRGDLTWLFSGQGVVAYGRRFGSETLLVILNASSQPVMLSVHVAGYLPDGARLRDVWQDSMVAVTGGRVDSITVPARSGIVLEMVGDGPAIPG
ncbi:MAG: glycoside hydrolase family 13 protein [Anaerolineae bacterium]|nr:glycoside hydrolase family 13 protein [Anaerolineae bacterium]